MTSNQQKYKFLLNTEPFYSDSFIYYVPRRVKMAKKQQVNFCLFFYHAEDTHLVHILEYIQCSNSCVPNHLPCTHIPKKQFVVFKCVWQSKPRYNSTIKDKLSELQPYTSRRLCAFVHGGRQQGSSTSKQKSVLLIRAPHACVHGLNYNTISHK